MSRTKKVSIVHPVDSHCLFRLRMDFVVHPSPPKTASVSGGYAVDQRRRRLRVQGNDSSPVYTSAATRHHAETLAATAAASESTNGPTNWRTERPSYLSQRLSRDLSTMLIDTDALGPLSREMTVIDSQRGPRGWFVERCTHTLASGQDVLFAFSYPAVPCLFMDQAIPFRLDVIYPTFVEENTRLEASALRLDLLRHIDSSSVGGKLCLERRNKVISKSDSSMILLTDVVCKDTTAAPTDEYSIVGHTTNESCRSFSGKLQIHSGLKQAQESLSASRCLRMDAINQAQAHISAPADQLTLPSFKFRGLSVEYTIAIGLSLDHLIASDDGALQVATSIPAVVETSRIQLQSQTSLTEQLLGEIRDRPTPAASIAVSRDELTSGEPGAEGVTPSQEQVSAERYLRRPLPPLPSHQEASNIDEVHLSIHPSSSTTANIDSKHPTHTEEERPPEEVECLYQSCAIVSTIRGRSATDASAQTIDGLPPPYCSPSLFESRRL